MRPPHIKATRFDRCLAELISLAAIAGAILALFHFLALLAPDRMPIQ